MKNRIIALAVSLLMAAPLANAEYLGLINGRSANPGNQPNLSVELGVIVGDLGVVDYQIIGARVNYRLTPEIVVIGDVGVSEFGEADGTPFGLGILYYLSNQRISQTMDIAGKASFHMADYKVGAGQGDVSNLTFEVLVSGAEPISANGVGWYGNVGYHRLNVDFGNSDSSNELGFGGGLTLPTRGGEAYAGFDFIDEMTFGLGFRYYVQ